MPYGGTPPQVTFYRPDSEFSQLFYTELGGTAGNNIPDTPTFSNEQIDSYWGAEMPAAPHMAWSFLTTTGMQGPNNKYNEHYTWAVTAGRVPPVPVPAAVWFMGTGLLSLLGLKRCGHKAN